MGISDAIFCYSLFKVSLQCLQWACIILKSQKHRPYTFNWFVNCMITQCVVTLVSPNVKYVQNEYKSHLKYNLRNQVLDVS